MAGPDLSILPGIPLDDEGPVFKSPWEAQAFAIVVKLQEQGVFTWQEWAQALGQTIADALEHGDPDLGDTYYEHWLTTLENLTLNKNLATRELLAERKEAAHQAHQALHGGHDHAHD